MRIRCYSIKVEFTLFVYCPVLITTENNLYESISNDLTSHADLDYIMVLDELMKVQH